MKFLLRKKNHEEVSHVSFAKVDTGLVNTVALEFQQLFREPPHMPASFFFLSKSNVPK